MRGRLLTLLFGMLCLMAPAAAAQELDSLQVYAGSLSEPPDDLPLQLPTVTLEPVFDDETMSYTVILPYSAGGTSLAAEAGIINKIVGVEGKAADETELEFSAWTYSGNFGNTGAIISFADLPDGDTTIRIAVEGIGRRNIYSVVVRRAAAASSSAGLTRLELASTGGRADAYTLTPEFGVATTQYAVDVPAGADGLIVNTAAEHAGSVVEVRGVSADGQPLVLEGSRVSGLVPGANTLEIAVTAEDGTTTSAYAVAVTRPVPDGDATLHELQLSEGPPSPGFMLTAMAGELPEGDVAPSPAFDPGVNSYAVAIGAPELTIRSRAAGQSGMAVSGRSPAGAELSVGNTSFIGNVTSGGVARGSFLSATVSGLAAGENAIEIVVTAEDGTTQSYTLIVTR